MNTRAIACYRSRRFPGRVSLFVPTVRDASNAFYRVSPTGGWDAVCDGVDVARLPGTHVSLLDQWHAGHVADLLSEKLERPQAMAA